MIDLHTHSIYSDGTMTPIEILKEAEKKKVSILSITDHDSVGAYKSLEKENISKYYSGHLIVGAELNCIYKKSRIELICYNFDYKKVDKYLSNYYSKDKVLKRKKEELATLIKLCQKNNIKLSENIPINDNMVLDNLYDDIIKYDENKAHFSGQKFPSKTQFFRICVGDDTFFLYNENKTLPPAQEISKLIKENGGQVFLAHPYVYDLKDHIDFINALYNDKIIDGLECYHSNFTKEQIQTLINYCHKKNLLMSGGTDFHGSKYPNINLATGYNNTLFIPEEITKNWLNF